VVRWRDYPKQYPNEKGDWVPADEGDRAEQRSLDSVFPSPVLNTQEEWIVIFPQFCAVRSKDWPVSGLTLNTLLTSIYLKSRLSSPFVIILSWQQSYFLHQTEIDSTSYLWCNSSPHHHSSTWHRLPMMNHSLTSQHQYSVQDLGTNELPRISGNRTRPQRVPTPHWL